jgi:hypothetical protein
MSLKLKLFAMMTKTVQIRFIRKHGLLGGRDFFAKSGVTASVRGGQRDEQTHPHRPRLVVSHSTCPPLSSSPHANSLVIGPAVIKHTRQPSPPRLHGACRTNTTGPPRDHGALQYHWTASATKPIGQRVPVQTRCILHGPEEQSRTRDG